MGLTYHHLDDDTVRASILAAWSSEWEDLLQDYGPRECYGKQLTEAGWDAFGLLMPQALSAHDDDWLRARMDVPEYWVPHLQRKTKTGFTNVDYNKSEAIDKLAFGEFNIAYIHGLAIDLLARGETECVVYRAGDAIEERTECTAWEESPVPLADVLAGHRARYHPAPGDRRAWSLPTGPNCHHSIRSLNS